MHEGTVRIHREAARDLIDVDDVIAIIDRLLTLGLRGEIVNVASGEAVPVERIVDHLERSLGLVARREYRDAGAHHVISVDKLRSLMPEVAGMEFGPAYYRRVLDRFTATYAATAGT
jgi:nucleoside-diphosphate-sugar epimerase